MYYDITPLYHLGKRRSLRDVQTSTRWRVDVQVYTAPQGPSGEPCLAARANGNQKQDPVPRLYKVQLECMATLGMVLAGVEVIDGQVFHQAWHCRPLEDTVVIPWTSCPRSSLDLLI